MLYNFLLEQVSIIQLSPALCLKSLHLSCALRHSHTAELKITAKLQEINKLSIISSSCHLVSLSYPLNTVQTSCPETTISPQIMCKRCAKNNHGCSFMGPVDNQKDFILPFRMLGFPLLPSVNH